jgi:hypothetical protein
MRLLYRSYLIALLFCFLTEQGMAKNYYIDPSSMESISNGSLTYPWKTISQVNMGTTRLLPGDSVLFKRGQLFTGRLIVSSSGTASSPIVYAAYGIGSMPELTNNVSDIIVINNRQYVVIDGLKLIDKTMSTSDHSIIAKIAYAIKLQNSPNCTIQNCEITLVGIAIAIQSGSNYTTVTSNYMHNLRAVRNTMGGDDDYGANALVIGSSNNMISKNKMEECWTTSYDYGYDGGAIEFFGSTISDNNIMYNTAVNCNGFIEIGSNTYGIADNNLMAYNKIINCGQVGTFHNRMNGFAIRINDLKIYNNVIVETKKQFRNVNSLFWFANPSQTDIVIIKNNIIWLNTGDRVVNNQDPSKLVHTNNIYKIRNGIIGVNIDTTERFNLDRVKIFKDTIGAPENWDYTLSPSSPAINFGTYVGLNNDYIGNSIIGNPDAGILEYQSEETNSTINLTAVVGKISCYGGVTNVKIIASGGVAPYLDTGSYIRPAGTHQFSVVDANGTTKIINVNITQPDSLQISVGYSVLNSLNLAATIRITVTGGTAPYTYQLNDGLYQQSNIFSDVKLGSYIVSVKDANGCIASKSVNPLITSLTNYVNEKIELMVTPNPSYSSFNISAILKQNSFGSMSLNVYNLFGALIYSAAGQSNVKYNIGNNFIPGMYILVVMMDGMVQGIKLVKL